MLMPGGRRPSDSASTLSGSSALSGPRWRGCHSPAYRPSAAWSLSSPTEGVSHRATPWLLLANSGHLLRPPASEGQRSKKSSQAQRGVRREQWGCSRPMLERYSGICQSLHQFCFYLLLIITAFLCLLLIIFKLDAFFWKKGIFSKRSIQSFEVIFDRTV